MRLFLLAFALLLSVCLAAQVPTYVPTDGLEVWTEFDGHYLNSLDGQVVWTEIGNPIFTNGRFVNDEAIRFPASANFIKSATPWYLPLQDHTTSIWFKSDDEQNPNQLIINSDPHTIIGVTINPWWSNSNSTIGACIGPGTGYWDMCGQFEIVSADYEEWNHLVTVRTGSEVKLFLNNVLVFERSGVAYNSIAPTDILLGESSHTTGFTDHEFIGVVDQFGYWTRPLNEDEISNLFNAQAPDPGCTDVTACNYDSEANLDDGSCIPSGCMEEGACNYNAVAECEGEACDYTCCPGPGCCSAGTHWDANLATCVVDVPDTVDAACTLMNLQELASGYAALVEQNAALDSLLAACEGDGAAEASGPCAGQDHVTYHGYEYAIVEIGDQCWFAENLRNEAFDDGTPIVLSNSDGDWTANASGPQRCAMNFSSSDADLYGYLYNFASVTSASGLCPSGFHVPTDSEFVTMEVFLGMPTSESYDTQRRGESQGVGDKMKDDVLMTGNNSSGFTALPGGLKRATVNGFNYYQQDGYWWTSSSASTDNAWYRGLSNLHPATYRRDYPKGTGFSVRCVKD